MINAVPGAIRRRPRRPLHPRPLTLTHHHQTHTHTHTHTHTSAANRSDNWDRSPDVAWPAVRKLAGEGIALDEFYTMPLCTPTRGSLMTGRWPLRLGLQHGVIIGGSNYGLPLNETTLPQKLKAVGYRTYGVGKWHLGYYNNESCPTNRFEGGPPAPRVLYFLQQNGQQTPG